ncbi:MAG: MBL fold metallo-hydrolase RNA specificity domain-containing protein [Dokdonella sp.]
MRAESGAMILAGSGMCDGGRVRHHLLHKLGRDRSSVVFVGYAAEATLARCIIDGNKRVRIFHEDIEVPAQIWTINDFSAHADQPTLLAWLGTHERRRVFIVHGEVDRGMQALQTVLGECGLTCQVPGMNEPIKID